MNHSVFVAIFLTFYTIFLSQTTDNSKLLRLFDFFSPFSLNADPLHKPPFSMYPVQKSMGLNQSRDPFPSRGRIPAHS